MWIRNAQVLDPKHSQPVDLEIQHGLISGIHPAKHFHAGNTSGFNTAGFDATAYWITPGFVNAHTHVAMSWMKSLAPQSPNLIRKWMFPIESNLKEEDVYLFSKMGIAECLLGGSTIIFDHYYFPHAIAQAAEELGIRAAIAPTVLSKGGPFGYAHLLQECKSFFNTKHSPHIIPIAGPHATDTLSETGFREVIQLARQDNLPIHLHVSQTHTEFLDTLKTKKMSPVAFLDHIGCFDQPTLAAHAIYLKENDFSILKRKKVVVVVCPSSLVLFDKLSPIIQFDRKNINYALGTDADICNDTMDMCKELRSFVMFTRVIQNSAHPKFKPNPTKILKSSRENALKILRKPELNGKIQVGQVADLLFIRKNSPNLSPMFDSRWAQTMSLQPEDIRHVMVGGKWVVKNRNLVYTNFHQLRLDFIKQIKKFMGRAGLKKHQLLA